MICAVVYKAKQRCSLQKGTQDKRNARIPSAVYLEINSSWETKRRCSLHAAMQHSCLFFLLKDMLLMLFIYLFIFTFILCIYSAIQ